MSRYEKFKEMSSYKKFKEMLDNEERVNDTKIVDSLLSSKSKLKLTLKQYTFLQQVKLQDKVTEAQRDWLISLSNKQKNII
jgi:isochorismate hydrolase